MLEKLKWMWLNRRTTESENEQLTMEYYNLRRQLIKLTREQRVVWMQEWDRLGAEGKPRPSTRYRHFAIRMNELARRMSKDSRLSMSVTGWSGDTITIKGIGKYEVYEISQPYYDRI